MVPYSDRRRFMRLEKPIAYRKAGAADAEAGNSTLDISPGGMRIHTNEGLEKGDRIELELLLDEGRQEWFKVVAKVAWTMRLDVGSAALYEIGLRFIELPEEDRRHLESALTPPPRWP